MESEFLLPFVGDFSDHSLEGELSDEEISRFLVFPDFPKGNCSGFESVGFLDSGGDGSRLPGDLLGDQLFSGNLLGSGFPGGLFSSSHFLIIFPALLNYFKQLLICYNQSPKSHWLKFTHFYRLSLDPNTALTPSTGNKTAR